MADQPSCIILPGYPQLCEASLEEALLRLEYSPEEIVLTTGRFSMHEARKILHLYQNSSSPNLFAPGVRIVVDSSLRADGWYLTINGRSAGVALYPP